MEYLFEHPAGEMDRVPQWLSSLGTLTCLKPAESWRWKTLVMDSTVPANVSIDQPNHRLGA